MIFGCFFVVCLLLLEVFFFAVPKPLTSWLPGKITRALSILPVLITPQKHNPRSKSTTCLQGSNTYTSSPKDYLDLFHREEHRSEDPTTTLRAWSHVADLVPQRPAMCLDRRAWTAAAASSAPWLTATCSGTG